jgi:predicted amidophosphoribosyltransferase
MTVTGRDGATWVVYPVLWCPRCGQERPCAGPYCQVCGADVEEAS